MEKKSNLLSIIFTTIILVVLFAAILVALSREGYLSFDKKLNETNDNKIENVQNADNAAGKIENSNTEENTNAGKENTNKQTDTNKTSGASMSTDEVFAFWKKIKGNWGHVNYDKENDMCSGTSLEINTNVKFAKFNSDGITTWNITSFEKLGDNKYKINLILPVNLNNEMNGDIKAIYNSITVDTSKLNDKKLIVTLNDTNVEFDYVSENKVIIDETTRYQYVDGGLKQDDYCKWYKENH